LAGYLQTIAKAIGATVSPAKVTETAPPSSSIATTESLLIKNINPNTNAPISPSHDDIPPPSSTPPLQFNLNDLIKGNNTGSGLGSTGDNSGGDEDGNGEGQNEGKLRLIVQGGAIDIKGTVPNFSSTRKVETPIELYIYAAGGAAGVAKLSKDRTTRVNTLFQGMRLPRSQEILDMTKLEKLIPGFKAAYASKLPSTLKTVLTNKLLPLVEGQR
jgi:hypothetical protein